LFAAMAGIARAAKAKQWSKSDLRYIPVLPHG
jgi:hypothetical protein